MKEICILTTKYSSEPNNPWLTNDIAKSFAKTDGFGVTVIALSWLPSDPDSHTIQNNGITEIRVKLPSIFYRKSRPFTALKLILFPFFTAIAALKAIKKCDLLIVNTPCIAKLGLPLFFKRFYHAKTLLIIWDFFPYYLKDIGYTKSKIAFKTLLEIEKLCFKAFDHISCMTERNIDFLINKYNYRTPEKTFQLPVWAEIRKPEVVDEKAVREKYGIPLEKCVAIYGGAITIVQKLENLLQLAATCSDQPVVFVVIGSGTDRQKIERKAKEMLLSNVLFLPPIPREEYNKLLAACDIGLIFLSEKLSVPSFPSKSLDYFRAEIPIIAGIDPFTDFGSILESRAKAGFACLADKTETLKSKLSKLVEDPLLRKTMGKNGRIYYESNMNVDCIRDTIISITA